MFKLMDKFSEVNGYFSPKIVSEINDTYVKIAIIKGDLIPWHKHEAEDELFYILDGKLVFEQEGIEPFTMKKGDMHKVSKGILHRVSAENECRIMLVESKSTKHTGNVVSSVTKCIEEQK